MSDKYIGVDVKKILTSVSILGKRNLEFGIS